MFRKDFTDTYGELKRHYLDSLGFDVPERYRSNFVHWGGGADAQYIHARFVADMPSGSRALIVGVMNGRDYFSAPKHGVRCHCL